MPAKCSYHCYPRVTTAQSSPAVTNWEVINDKAQVLKLRLTLSWSVYKSSIYICHTNTQTNHVSQLHTKDYY